MTVLMWIMSAVLLALAGLHILWGIGFWWPIRDERRLVAAVIGVTTATRMPGPIPCALVAVALIFAASWPWFPPGLIRQTGLGVAAVVFTLRGTVPFWPAWARLTAQEPFHSNDRRYYGPLCLALGAGFIFLFLKG